MCEYCYDEEEQQDCGYKDLVQGKMKIAEEEFLMQVWIDRGDMKLSAGFNESNTFGKLKINYCPMCGRKF